MTPVCHQKHKYAIQNNGFIWATFHKTQYVRHVVVKISSNVESSRYVTVTLQTKKKNHKLADAPLLGRIKFLITTSNLLKKYPYDTLHF